MRSLAVPVFVLLLAGMVIAETPAWYRIVSTQQTAIVEFSADHQLAWTNELDGAEARVERTWWTDGYWSPNFTATTVAVSGRWVRVQLPATNAIPDDAQCCHNLFMILKAKWRFFEQTGYLPVTYGALLSAGLPTGVVCPNNGLYSIGYGLYDPVCSYAAGGHTI